MFQRDYILTEGVGNIAGVGLCEARRRRSWWWGWDLGNKVELSPRRGVGARPVCNGGNGWIIGCVPIGLIPSDGNLHLVSFRSTGCFRIVLLRNDNLCFTQIDATQISQGFDTRYFWISPARAVCCRSSLKPLKAALRSLVTNVAH